MSLSSSGEGQDQELLWKKWINDKDSHAGDSLMRQYMPLVQFHVQRISVGLPQSVDREELKSFGMMGLYDALEKFDLSRDLKFDTYASFRVRGAIIDGLRKEDWLPRSVREKTKKIEAAIERLAQRYNRSASSKEIAEEVGMTEEEVESAITESYFANVLSIDETNKDNEESKDSIANNIKDQSVVTPEENVMKKELYSDLSEVIKDLNEKEQLVISLFYKEELTLTEIGEVMGLSTSRISQIHSKAIYKLKDLLKKVMH